MPFCARQPESVIPYFIDPTTAPPTLSPKTAAPAIAADKGLEPVASLAKNPRMSPLPRIVRALGIVLAASKSSAAAAFASATHRLLNAIRSLLLSLAGLAEPPTHRCTSESQKTSKQVPP